MNHPSPSEAQRLAAIPAEDRDRFAALPIADQLAELEGLAHEQDQLGNRIGELGARIKGLGVILARGMLAEGLASLATERGDGATMVWTINRDRRGFMRQRLGRPRSLEGETP